MSRKPARYNLGSIILIVGALPAATPALAADYYAGKSVDMIVGNYPGGGFDIYARAVARHLGRNIPGNPTIVVKNIPGAGSAKAGYQVSTIAPKDGLTFGTFAHDLVLVGLLGHNQNIQFDSRKFTWLGSSSSFANDAYLLIARPGAMLGLHARAVNCHLDFPLSFRPYAWTCM